MQEAKKQQSKKSPAPLSDELRSYLQSRDVYASYEGIANELQIPPQKRRWISALVYRVISGADHIERLPTFFQSVLGLSAVQAKTLARLVGERVLLRVQDQIEGLDAHLSKWGVSRDAAQPSAPDAEPVEEFVDAFLLTFPEKLTDRLKHRLDMILTAYAMNEKNRSTTVGLLKKGEKVGGIALEAEQAEHVLKRFDVARGGKAFKRTVAPARAKPVKTAAQAPSESKKMIVTDVRPPAAPAAPAKKPVSAPVAKPVAASAPAPAEKQVPKAVPKKKKVVKDPASTVQAAPKKAVVPKAPAVKSVKNTAPKKVKPATPPTPAPVAKPTPVTKAVKKKSVDVVAPAKKKVDTKPTTSFTLKKKVVQSKDVAASKKSVPKVAAPPEQVPPAPAPAPKTKKVSVAKSPKPQPVAAPKPKLVPAPEVKKSEAPKAPSPAASSKKMAAPPKKAARPAHVPAQAPVRVAQVLSDPSPKPLTKKQEKIAVPQVAPKKVGLDTFTEEDAKEVGKIAKIKEHVLSSGSKTVVGDLVDTICQNKDFAFKDDQTTARCKKIVEARVRDVRDAFQTRRQIESSQEQGGLGVTGRKLADMTAFMEKTIQDHYAELHAELDAQKADRVQKTVERSEQKTSHQQKQGRVMTKKYVALTGKAPAAHVVPAAPAKSRVSVGVSASKQQEQLAQKIDTQKVRAAIKKTAVAPAPVPSSVPKTASGRPKLADVQFTRALAGPVDELRSMSRTEFHRLSSDPKQAIAKIKSKVDLLGEEGYAKKVAGIKAWRTSPLNKMYIQISQNALLNGLTMEQALEQAKAGGGEVPTADEMHALTSLNGTLRF